MDNLKSCSCGGEAYMMSCGDSDDDVVNYCVACRLCHKPGKWKGTKAEAIEAWNILNENLNGDEYVQLPSPCVRVGDEDLKNWTSKEWFLKIGEELFEAVEAKTMQRQYPALYEGALAEELMDIITVCRSYLHALGYEGKTLRNLVEKVDKKNGDRGRLLAFGGERIG